LRFLIGISLFVIFTCHSLYAQQQWELPDHNLYTKWGRNIDPKNVLPEYPRPHMVRSQWLNLNGLWDYAIVKKELQEVRRFDGEILVPFPVEAALSGVKKAVSHDEKLWYRRPFALPKEWKDKKILLNFGAVDWETTVWVNGIKVGTHRGGYDAFTFDITNALNNSGDQIISISVWDPTDTSEQPRGKQVSNPHGIWYTAVTGIWQTVWLEPVEKDRGYIKSLKIVPDIDKSTVQITADIEQIDKDHTLKLILKENGTFISQKAQDPEKPLILKIKNSKLWSGSSHCCCAYSE